jgi:hypothetical protein
VARCGKSPILSICCHCGSPLEPKSAIGVEKRPVFDLPERPPVVTENRYDCRQLVYVGYGEREIGAMGVVNPVSMERVKDFKLGSHPEAFRLEQGGSRIFFRLPTRRASASSTARPAH